MVPPLSEKVGGRVPRVPRLIAPMPLSRLIVHINSYTIKNEKTFCFPYAHSLFLCRLQVSNCQPWVSSILDAYLLIDGTFAQPCIFAVVNCADVALSVFYSPILTRCRIFLQV